MMEACHEIFAKYFFDFLYLGFSSLLLRFFRLLLELGISFAVILIDRIHLFLAFLFKFFNELSTRLTEYTKQLLWICRPYHCFPTLSDNAEHIFLA